MTERPVSSNRGALVVGGLLIIIGLAFLAAQALDIDVGRYGWPLYVIVPGVVIWILALLAGGPVSVGFSIVGAIITVTGFVLAYQEASGYWASWAYAWALVAPGAVGLALLVHGLVHGDRELLESGARVAVVGLALFLGFGFFFEEFVGLGTSTPAAFREVVLPAGVVVLGVGLLVGGLLSARRRPG